jgi:branched-chain amino acid transport system permease protein
VGLKRIVLRDFVIVEALDLELANGFTVLTGETGAGKSILVDALQLVTGARAEAGVIREGAQPRHDRIPLPPRIGLPERREHPGAVGVGKGAQVGEDRLGRRGRARGPHREVAVGLGTLLGLLCGLLLSAPLARLRGVYQAIASLAFVEILVALILYFEELTGGPLGFHNIPRLVTPWVLFFAMLGTMALLTLLGRGGIGRAFDAMRQDPSVAASLGVNPSKYHVLSFALSGAIAGLFGGLDALRNFSLTAEQFGFSILIGTLSAVVLGGRRAVLGPLVGTTILVLLPEIFRPLADYRQAVYGLLLVVVMAFLPFGVYDTIVMKLHNRRLARAGMLAPKVPKAMT